jgi:hypothetical protein
MFYWKCQICKESIRNDHVEKWMDNRLAHFHGKCLNSQGSLEQQADELLKKAKVKGVYSDKELKPIAYRRVKRKC